jgi:hypothetical protein
MDNIFAETESLHRNSIVWCGVDVAGVGQGSRTLNGKATATVLSWTAYESLREVEIYCIVDLTLRLIEIKAVVEDNIPSQSNSDKSHQG